MLGAIFVGLSGMEAYAKGLKTISNNVANLDTLGYKSSTISFSDLFGENAGGLAYTSSHSGGSTGNGVRYGQERIDFNQGSYQQTGNALDLSIQGNGFLVVRNEGGDTFYTRTGQFSVDSKGFITNQNGDRLVITTKDNKLETVDTGQHLTNLPEATKTLTISQAIGLGVTGNAQIQNVQVYDAMGSIHVWTIKLSKNSAQPDSTKTVWTVKVFEGETQQMGDAGEIAFNNNNGFAEDPKSFSITASPPNAAQMTVKLDFATATMNAGTASSLAAKADGHAVGSLTSVEVNAQGKLVLDYSNEQKVELGDVTIADVQDLQQLTRVGNGLFKNSGTGQLVYRISGKNGIGTLQTGQVEASNVNLTSEFGNLILIQRGFDASSQVISASNDMIQALFGMRGHG